MAGDGDLVEAHARSRCRRARGATRRRPTLRTSTSSRSSPVACTTGSSSAARPASRRAGSGRRAPPCGRPSGDEARRAGDGGWALRRRTVAVGPARRAVLLWGSCCDVRLVEQLCPPRLPAHAGRRSARATRRPPTDGPCAGRPGRERLPPCPLRPARPVATSLRIAAHRCRRRGAGRLHPRGVTAATADAHRTRAARTTPTAALRAEIGRAGAALVALYAAATHGCPAATAKAVAALGARHDAYRQAIDPDGLATRLRRPASGTSGVRTRPPSPAPPTVPAASEGIIAALRKAERDAADGPAEPVACAPSTPSSPASSCSPAPAPPERPRCSAEAPGRERARQPRRRARRHRGRGLRLRPGGRAARPARRRPRAVRAMAVHRTQRDRLRARIIALGGEPGAAAAAYDPPFAVDDAAAAAPAGGAGRGPPRGSVGGARRRLVTSAAAGPRRASSRRSARCGR